MGMAQACPPCHGSSSKPTLPNPSQAVLPAWDQVFKGASLRWSLSFRPPPQLISRNRKQLATLHCSWDMEGAETFTQLPRSVCLFLSVCVSVCLVLALLLCLPLFISVRVPAYAMVLSTVLVGLPSPPPHLPTSALQLTSDKPSQTSPLETSFYCDSEHHQVVIQTNHHHGGN